MSTDDEKAPLIPHPRIDYVVVADECFAAVSSTIRRIVPYLWGVLTRLLGQARERFPVLGEPVDLTLGSTN